MEILARKEANFRLAVRWVAEDGLHAAASILGDTFGVYLQRSGRLRERDTWVAWLAAEVRTGGFSEALVGREHDEAWTLITQGQAAEAIRRLEDLRVRLRKTTDFDPAFKLASTQAMLGHALDHCGQSEHAILVMEEAIQLWEALVLKAGGQQWETLVTKPDRKKAGNTLGNHAATLGYLANALMYAGKLDQALNTSARGLKIRRSLGHDAEVATGEGRCAQILMEQGRLAEADALYDAALTAAHRAEDKELEGSLLQHQGILADEMNQYARAAKLHQQTLNRFQEMNHDVGIMLTCNSLGVVEQNQGRFSEARAWYERSREFARRLGAVNEMAQAAQNIGLVCQQDGQAARKQCNEPRARQCFEEAKQSIQEAVGLMRQLKDEAERHAHQAREIRERLGLKEVHLDYHNLADIARARGNEAQSTEWQRKRDAVRAELKRRAQGSGGLTPQFIEAIQQVSRACARAAVERVDLDPNAESALAQIEKLPAPMSDLAAFLRRLAAGEIPSIPSTLQDDDLHQHLTQLLDAVKEAHEG